MQHHPDGAARFQNAPDFLQAARNIRVRERNARPLNVGEFGAYEVGDMASRARWTRAVVEEAERRGFSWTYWEFCSGFGAYDPIADAWREPLLQALMNKR